MRILFSGSPYVQVSLAGNDPRLGPDAVTVPDDLTRPDVPSALGAAR